MRVTILNDVHGKVKMLVTFPAIRYTYVELMLETLAKRWRKKYDIYLFIYFEMLRM